MATPLRSTTLLIVAAVLAPSHALAQAPSLIAMWGSYGTGDTQFNTPVGIALDHAGNVYVVDSNANRIQKFNNDGVFIAQWGGYGAGAGQLWAPQGLAVDADGNVFVTDSGNDRVQEFTSAGAFIRAWGGPGFGPTCVAVDPGGDVFVSALSYNRIQRFTRTGTLLDTWSVAGADGIGTDQAGSVYACVPSQGVVLRFTNSGAQDLSLTPPRNGATQPVRPVRVAASVHGLIYVDDYLNCRIQVFTSDGAYITQWGSCGSAPGQFLSPIGIAVDANENVYVADTNNSRIQKFGPVPTPTATASWGSLKTRYR